MPSDAERRKRSQAAADGIVAYYLGPREGPRTDGAPRECDYLETLYRDLIAQVFQASPSLRVPRPDGVAVGLHHPTMALHSFAYDLVRAARDHSIDPPYREWATVALAIGMVLRSAIPNAEDNWRAMRRSSMQVHDEWSVAEYSRQFGSPPPEHPPHLIPPDLRAELEALAADPSIALAAREVARQATLPQATSEILGFTRRCRTAVVAGEDQGAPSAREAGTRPQLTPPLPRFDHSPDFVTVRWEGEALPPFTPLQAACVRVLWEAWMRRTPAISLEAIREAAGSAADRFRVDVTFRDHPAWGKMIVRVGKGRYRLAGEPPENLS